MKTAAYPSLYQVNTRAWLTDLSVGLGRKATLDDIPDSELDRMAMLGFDWIWLLSVWSTGLAGQQLSRSDPALRHEFQETLSDLREDDIAGSGFAITAYTVHPALGGNAALARIRQRLRTRGMRLMLDFVPNHTALDNPWAATNPEFYIHGSEADLAREPRNYTRAHGGPADLVLAHGRDPYFPGWPDTLQLDYSNPATQEKMAAELERIATMCDGVRCDMAMLVLPDVFERTWGRRAPEFWPNATQRARRVNPGFEFMAEVYWDREWDMLQRGFDYAYDKRLYDRLHEQHARPVREHLFAGLDYQSKLARFMENHDEPRAATSFPSPVDPAAAMVTYLSPGLRFFHEKQFQGWKKRISPHLIRRPVEPVDRGLAQFYDHLLPLLRHTAVRNGRWRLLQNKAAWDGNWTADCFITSSWDTDDGQRLLIAVNYAPNQSQCFVQLPFDDLRDHEVRLENLMGTEKYDRDGNELTSRGLYLDMPPWGYQAFEITAH